MSTRTFRIILQSVVAVSALTFGSAASAQPNFFFSRPTFISALTTTQTNDLNALANGATVISFGALGTGTLSGATVTSNQITKPGAPFTFSITFSQAISGFGADFTNTVAPVGAAYSVFNGAASVGGGVVSFGSTGLSTFFGIIPSGGAFNRIEIRDVGAPIPTQGPPSTFASLDNLTVGVSLVSTVPEPTTIALLATGLLAVGGMARHRRRITR